MKKYRVVVNETEYVVSVEPLVEDEEVQVTAPAPQPVKEPETSGNVAPSTQAEPKQPAGAVDPSAVPLEAPLRGTILKVLAQEGATVNEGDVLFTLEALKLENEITAPVTGVVAQVLVKEGDSVDTGDVLATFRTNG